MFRWFANLSIVIKAFAVPVLLLLCLCFLSIRTYSVISEAVTGFDTLSGSKIPMWNAAERLSDGLSDTQLLLFRYISWLNSGVDANTLTKAQHDLESRGATIAERINALLGRRDLPNYEREILESVSQNWTRFRKLTKDSAEMGAVQPSMAVMMLGEVDELMQKTRQDISKISQSIKLSAEGRANTMARSSRQSQILLITALAIIFPLSILVSIVTVISIVRPIKEVTRNMGALSLGEDAKDIGYSDRTDEVGRMVRAIAIFRQNVSHIRALEDRQQQERQRNIQARKREMDAIASEFETSVKSIASRFTDTAERIDTSSITLARNAAETRSQSEMMKEIVQVTSFSVQTVASAAQQMSDTVQEIAAQGTKAGDFAKCTAAETQRVSREVVELIKAIEHITSILEMIQEISERTNLLALNASIEAARAGEAGRGFGVVAAEVKALASQTDSATNEISTRIASSRASCSIVAKGIETIVDAMHRVDNLSQTIAVSISEQAAATAEIARNSTTAMSSVQQVEGVLSRLVNAANQTDEVSKLAKEKTSGLLRDAEIVNQEVDRFLASVRAA